MVLDEASSHQPASRRMYPTELKLAAVRAVIDEGKSYQAVADEFGISSPSTLKKWLIAYRREGESALETKQRGRAQGAPLTYAPVFDPLDPEQGYRMRKENTRLAAKLRK